MNNAASNIKIQRVSALQSPILGICSFLVIFTVLFSWGFTTDPDYFTDALKQRNPDARQYVQLARNIVDSGVYSRHAKGLGEPDMLRTPGYPLFLIATLGFRHVATLYLAQAALVCGLILLLFRIGTRLNGSLCGAIAAILCGTDLLLIVSCFEAMSEILFVFFTVLAFDILRWPFLSLKNSKPGNFRWILGGLVLGLSTLVRPSNLYLPIVLVLSLSLLWMSNTRHYPLRKPFFFLLLGFVILVAPWIFRNAVVLGVPKITTVDKHNLVYFVGAGAYQREFGWTRQEAQSHIASEFELPTYTKLQNHWTADGKSVKQLYNEVNTRSLEVAMRYPRSLIEASVIGVSKATIAHSCNEIGHLTGTEWHSLGQFEQNSIALYGTLAWQLLHTSLTFSLVAIGVVISFIKKKNRLSIAIIMLTLAYYYLIVAMFGIDAVGRARISCLPVLFILAGLGASFAACELRDAQWKEKLIRVSKLDCSPKKDPGGTKV